ncbi:MULTISPECIES: aldo/keto reductase [Rhizobium]|uniref:Aldo/keto reductase n=1 Tax=Rhizobium aouanii TaxID=3118145 RepID=A0ABU8CJD7_9HYPH|nr:aldo/keto reductase [Rhizobium acaciae]MCW1410862.1 aldo/keto reductase [Rhizobium acaciae]MCW1742839.1 aldo/keto reductase [Rhizobium acaciae]MCW1750035.1 aldo/keto reductase [Rhizobium acaciae]
MQRLQLAPNYEISRVIRGSWQLASGHGTARSDDPIADMVASADAGITSFDCADIYTGVEELIGNFRKRYRDLRGEQALDRIKVHTKFVPEHDMLPRISKPYVEAMIDQSLKRLNQERLDLVQLHWWEYRVPRWLDAALWLDELRRAGKIDKIGGTNFDTDHMLEIANAGVPLTSMQVQYSLLDRRPARRMAGAAVKNGVSLLCYGTMAGGFLGDRWLGAPEPTEPLENRSLIKYKRVIDDIGGWDLFQALLTMLRQIADRQGTDIATVASAAILEWPGVAAVIIGARNRSHLISNVAISGLALTTQDRDLIAGVLAETRPLEGDVYGLERDHWNGSRIFNS